MNRIQTYYLISDILCYSNLNRNQKEHIIRMLSSAKMDWSLFIQTGSNHLVLQTIYSKLIEFNLTENIPPEVIAHLKYIYDLNFKRNKEILNQVISINNTLKKQDVIPIYIKGVGNIIDGLYNNIADRIMYDIDLLIPDDQWELAINMLLQDGYKANKEYNPSERNETKHYPKLIKPDARAYVEVHRLPVDYEYIGALNAKEVLQYKKFVSEPYNCFVLGDQHKIIQNFIHSQLKHNGNAFARVFLRNLYDLWLLSKREDLEKVFEGLNNYQKQAAGYLRIMRNAFDTLNLKKKKLKFSGWFYTLRCKINLRWQIIDLANFLTWKMFLAYVKTPLQALTDAELRKTLIKKISSKKWYVQHFASYKQIYVRDYDLYT